MSTDEILGWKASSEEAKKNLILDASLRVFGTRGFDEPTMDDIALEAGYSRRSLYRFFSSKQDIGVALAQRSCQILIESLGPMEDLSLFQFVWTYLEFSRAHPLEFRIVIDTRPFAKPNLQDQDFILALGSRLGPVGREALAAAIGYVEFLFRYRKTWEMAGFTREDEAVKAVLMKILSEEYL
jgi:AcrR family transcriptional regulator